MDYDYYERLSSFKARASGENLLRQDHVAVMWRCGSRTWEKREEHAPAQEIPPENASIPEELPNQKPTLGKDDPPAENPPIREILPQGESLRNAAPGEAGAENGRAPEAPPAGDGEPARKPEPREESGLNTDAALTRWPAPAEDAAPADFRSAAACREALLAELQAGKESLRRLAQQQRAAQEAHSQLRERVLEALFGEPMQCLADLERRMTGSDSAEIQAYGREVQRILGLLGAESFTPAEGEPFDGKTCEKLDTQAPGLTVAECVAPGWRAGERLLCRAVVTVKE